MLTCRCGRYTCGRRTRRFLALVPRGTWERVLSNGRQTALCSGSLILLFGRLPALGELVEPRCRPGIPLPLFVALLLSPAIPGARTVCARGSISARRRRGSSACEPVSSKPRRRKEGKRDDPSQRSP